MQHPADLVAICGLLEVLWVAEGGLHGLDQEVVAALVGEADQELHQLTGGQLCGRRADASLSTSTGCSWLYTDRTLSGSPQTGTADHVPMACLQHYQLANRLLKHPADYNAW